ncbi:SDR family oxidoreductase [Lysobacter koreensis]|uniref:SDR family oxidoreductase n=1 Tax=Lysobacter koreensis TaxID=266122 RepID=A0ABW2YSP9_9GAMM
MPAHRSLVTGANRGLGLEFCRQLLARGERVVAACRQPGRAHALNQLAGDHPGRLHLLPLDVADAKSRAALVAELPLVCDGLDLLVNNAGVLHSGERFGAVPAANLDDSLHTNATGPFLLSQALAPLLADGAKVANLSSRWGSIAELEAFRTPSYAISKAAQNMASALLAHGLRERGIVVLALNPGWVQTEMGGAGAPLSATQAVASLLQVIDAATLADSGRFLDHDGQSLPW